MATVPWWLSPVNPYSGYMTMDEAPGRLDDVRVLLNTSGLGNDAARTPFDHLGDLGSDPGEWSKTFVGLPAPVRGQLPQIRQLRDDLRPLLGSTHPGSALASWLSRVPLAVTLPDDGPRALRIVPRHRSTAGTVLAAVAEAAGDGIWPRLRSCPDCRFVFYDSSRRGGRTWCRMARDDEHGRRSCGNIAKARAKRTRDRVASVGVEDGHPPAAAGNTPRRAGGDQ